MPGDPGDTLTTDGLEPSEVAFGNQLTPFARLLAHRLLYGIAMRNADPFFSIDSLQLVAITGGCGKKCAPPPPQQPPPRQAPAPDRGVSVEVATGAGAAQLIGGGAPTIQG